MSIKVIIFDFDGTVADTFDALVKITNNLAPEFGYLPATPEEISKIKDLTTREIIQRSGVAIYKLPFLLRKVIAELNSQIHALSPIFGMQTALSELKEQGNKLGIITSNNRENVQV
ncbi:MAG TPA: HAD hydrolase-like protein, partial [Phormidium sp.]